MQIGDTIPSESEAYTVEERIGGGGMGVTWQVRRERDGEVFVYKELRVEALEDWKAAELFEREVEVMRGLDLDGVPRFIDAIVDRDERHVGYVQQLAPGRPLSELVSGSDPLPPERFEGYLRRLLSILAELHAHTPSIVHRDINPSNLLVDGDDLWVIDFGAVKASLRESTQVTSVGTFGYMAPEQTLGRASPASDLYGAGMTFVALAARATPEDLDVDPNTGRVDVSKATATLPLAQRELLAALTEPAPAARPDDAMAALAMLDAPGVPATIPPPAEATSQPPPSNRRRNLSIAAAILTAAMVLPYGCSLIPREHEERRLGGWFSGHGAVVPGWTLAVFGDANTFTRQNAIDQLAFSDDGARLASFSNHELVIWDVATGSQLCSQPLESGYESGEQARWSPDGELVWMALYDTRVYAYDGQTCEPKQRTQQLHQAIEGMSKGSLGTSSLLREPDGRLLNIVSYGTDFVAATVGTTKPEIVRRWRGGGGALRVVASADGSTIASLGRTSGPIFRIHSYRMSDPRGARSKTLQFPNDSHVNAIALSPDGTVGAALDQHRVVIFDPHEPSFSHNLDLGRFDYDFLHDTPLAFSPDGTRIAAVSGEYLVVLDPRDNSIVRELTGHRDDITSLAFSPDGETLASGSKDRTLSIWKLP